MKADIFGEYYNPTKVLSYNKPFILSIGSRSIGKSTGWALQILDEFINKGRKFVYMRRTKDETMDTCVDWFNNAVALLNMFDYNIEEFYYNKKKYFIRLKDMKKPVECGYVVPLSQVPKMKSRPFDKIFTILYDEFIAPEKKLYLGNKDTFLTEYKYLLSFYITCDRDINKPFRNEVKVVCLGNCDSFYNPIIMGLGADKYIRTDSKYVAPKNNKYVIELTTSVSAIKDIENSNAYILSDEANRQYNFNNIAFDSSNAFIKKIDSPMNGILNISINNNTYGVYIINKLQCVYVSHKTNNSYTLALTQGDHNEINKLLALNYRQYPQLQSLRNNYLIGNIFFENKRIKYDLDNYFMLSP